MTQTRVRSSRWWRIAALIALMAPVVLGTGIARAQDAESTPESEAPYYTDTQSPPQPGGFSFGRDLIR